MKRSLLILLLAGGSPLLLASPVRAQRAGLAPRNWPERAIRHDIPMTDMIRRAFAAGTRDSTGRPGAKYWQLWLDYTINAKLDPESSTLTGHETVVIHNNSDSAMTSIVMRLDQNIFRGSVSRAAPTVPSEITDGMVLTRLALNGQAVDLDAQPAFGRGGRGGRGGGGGLTEPMLTGATQTSARLLLPSPVAGKSSAMLDIDWHFKLAGGPGGSGHRMTARWADSLYQVTQWYPRIAVFDDLRQGGWDTDPYLGPSEFYNNFGRFDVRIDVPAGWIVGATGVLQNAQDVLTPVARERLSHVLESNDTRMIVSADEAGPGRATAAGDRLVWHFVADTVNDFAWGTAKQFVWQATRATIPGRGPVPVNMYFLPGNASRYENAPEAGRHALEFYSKLWMPYSFPQLTMLDGPDTGMEYPMLIMSNQGAADHETGHSWWPMTVSNNETWYGWMDEGFNQYMNILSGADARGQPPALDGRGQSYGQRSGNEQEGALMWDANYGGPGYSYQAYSKTPLMLSMLGGIVGDSAVWRAHSDYAKAWRFKHPSPWDYMFFMSRALRQDLGWFWYYWLFTTEAVDGSIQNVATSGTHTVITVRQDGPMPSPVVLRLQLAGSGALPAIPNSVQVDAGTVDVTWPVAVWFNGSRTFQATVDLGARRLEKVTLDPHGRFPDSDVSDNTWPRDPNATPARGRGRGRGGALPD